MADLEEDIESLVRRNEVVDEEFQGMKTDIASLSDKILVIKVSFESEFLTLINVLLNLNCVLIESKISLF